MNQAVLPLVNWSNGVVMIGIFAAVVVLLIVILISFMNSERKS